ncbi:uncharacterized protein LOC100372072 [Saccoglossus kowalevskii]|uniref:Uncharacterized protein LOC100372072 n=1 Tax=Saccoglossus kowalevskii TaxID=10224 RepID=A0ABM0GRF6_SACKO|nr:PREDICTED: uncharacterized protein LOC100372072 [Saccoglossus kowalevskii]
MANSMMSYPNCVKPIVLLCVAATSPLLVGAKCCFDEYGRYCCGYCCHGDKHKDKDDDTDWSTIVIIVLIVILIVTLVCCCTLIRRPWIRGYYHVLANPAETPTTPVNIVTATNPAYGSVVNPPPYSPNVCNQQGDQTQQYQYVQSQLPPSAPYVPADKYV